MKFPVVQKGESYFPTDSKCPMCQKALVKPEKVEQVVLTVGAMKKTGKGWDKGWSGLGNHDLGGILTICTHSHNSDMPGVSVDVVDLAGNGQADLVFCSTKCLRAFLNTVVDEVERKMGRKI